MTRIDKLLNRFLENPKSLKFKKIEKILLNLGFEKVSIKGSHHKFSSSISNIKFTIPVHNNNCNKFYKKEVAQLIKNYLTFLKNDNETI